jgi:carbamoyltransferase
MNILGIKMEGHDTGACLISGDRVVAIAQERLDRVKNSGALPTQAVEYCLTTLDVTTQAIDLVAVERIAFKTDGEMESKFRNFDTNRLFANTHVVSVGHHDAHAASPFFAPPLRGRRY